MNHGSVGGHDRARCECQHSCHRHPLESGCGSPVVAALCPIGFSSVPDEFNIDLSCAGGHAASLVAVAATIADSSNPLSRSDRLALTASSAAKGVVIQVLRHDNVLKLGPDASAPGAINQWSAGQAGNGLFRLPLAAANCRQRRQSRPAQQTDAQRLPSVAPDVGRLPLVRSGSWLVPPAFKGSVSGYGELI